MVRGLAAIAAIMLSACAYSADYGDCAVQCDDASGCPDGLTCGAEGLCRAAEADACVLPSDGTGGKITHVEGRTIHTLSASQSGSVFVPPVDVGSVELLVVAGGGGGGSTRGGGGAGAGGVTHVTDYTIAQPSYIVTVGYGGASATNGNNSTFGTITTIGGGCGRPCSAPDGGSGGGAAHDSNQGPAGDGTSAQGNAGGMNGSYNLSLMTFTGAGGGGAGDQGTSGLPNLGGTGGPGLAFTISGVQIYYGGGGGGGDQDVGNHGLSPGAGGIGGGGEGGLNSTGKNAVNGSGGGGGGGGGGDPSDNFYSGGRGGDGAVIVSYKTSR